MKKFQTSYRHLSGAERLGEIMHATGLDLSGFSAFVHRSEPHLYALLNGVRPVTDDLILLLEAKLGVKPASLFDPAKPLPVHLDKVPLVREFRKKTGKTSSPAKVAVKGSRRTSDVPVFKVSCVFPGGKLPDVVEVRILLNRQEQPEAGTTPLSNPCSRPVPERKTTRSRSKDKRFTSVFLGENA